MDKLNLNDEKNKNYIEIDGDVKIPIIKMEDIVTPVFNFFNLDLGDQKIMEKATKYLDELVVKNDFEKMRSYLWIDPVINVETINHAVVFGSNGLKTFRLLEAEIGKESSDRIEITTPYSRWIAAQGIFIKKILEQTKEEDAAIQHWLNYEDFILELVLTQTGCEIITEIYKLRGLDFFLFHYIGGETLATKDKALFYNAMRIPIALNRIACKEESIQVKKEIEKREKGLIQISNKYGPIKQNNEVDFILEKLRVEAERFWNDYLSNKIWRRLHRDSRIDLVDSFISEILLENGVLQGWSQTILSLCKVVEREMSITIFEPYIEIIRRSVFIEKENVSSTKAKRVKSRKITFEIIKKCATNPMKTPTLGQLLFMLKFLDDSIMDECTDLFKEIRRILEKKCKDSKKHIINLIHLLEKEYTVGFETANIIELRNASAHPGREGTFSWSKYSSWLKETIGHPPEYILNILILKLRLTFNELNKDEFTQP